VSLNRAWAGFGLVDGCTATLVLQTGWLLTIANLGDSAAVLDNGATVMQARPRQTHGRARVCRPS
jgi:Protein phosphatase 2C